MILHCTDEKKEKRRMIRRENRGRYYPPPLLICTPQIFNFSIYIFSTVIPAPLPGRGGGKPLIYACGLGLPCNLSRAGEGGLLMGLLLGKREGKETEQEIVKNLLEFVLMVRH